MPNRVTMSTLWSEALELASRLHDDEDLRHSGTLLKRQRKLKIGRPRWKARNVAVRRSSGGLCLTVSSSSPGGRQKECVLLLLLIFKYLYLRL